MNANSGSSDYKKTSSVILQSHGNNEFQSEYTGSVAHMSSTLSQNLNYGNNSAIRSV